MAKLWQKSVKSPWFYKGSDTMPNSNNAYNMARIKKRAIRLTPIAQIHSVFCKEYYLSLDNNTATAMNTASQDSKLATE